MRVALFYISLPFLGLGDFKLHFLFCNRVLKSERSCMKCQPVKRICLRTVVFVSCKRIIS